MALVRLMERQRGYTNAPKHDRYNVSMQNSIDHNICYQEQRLGFRFNESGFYIARPDLTNQAGVCLGRLMRRCWSVLARLASANVPGLYPV